MIEVSVFLRYLPPSSDGDEDVFRKKVEELREGLRYAAQRVDTVDGIMVVPLPDYGRGSFARVDLRVEVPSLKEAEGIFDSLMEECGFTRQDEYGDTMTNQNGLETGTRTLVAT